MLECWALALFALHSACATSPDPFLREIELAAGAIYAGDHERAEARLLRVLAAEKATGKVVFVIFMSFGVIFDFVNGSA